MLEVFRDTIFQENIDSYVLSRAPATTIRETFTVYGSRLNSFRKYLNFGGSSRRSSKREKPKISDTTSCIIAKGMRKRDGRPHPPPWRFRGPSHDQSRRRTLPSLSDVVWRTLLWQQDAAIMARRTSENTAEFGTAQKYRLTRLRSGSGSF